MTHRTKRASRGRRGVWGGAAVLAAASVTLLTPAAHAQNPPPSPPANPSNAAPAPPSAQPPLMENGMRAGRAPLPTSVLLFPALVTGADGTVAAATPTTRQAQEIVTVALQKYLEKGGVGTVVYSSRLPSIERAVSEGVGISSEAAAKGPGDDPRAGQRFADIVGASEYLTVTVDNYKYDAPTRRATFTLSIVRSEANGTPINTTAFPATGDAPADVSPSRQEGSAVARAAEVVAEQTVRGLYPATAANLDPPAPKKARKRSKLGWLIPAVAAGVALIVPR